MTSTLDGISVDSDDIELVILDTGERLTRWTSYTITSSFLQPTDEWSVILDDERAGSLLIDKLLPGTRIRLLVNGHPQLTGPVDRSVLKSSREGGTSLVVQGRDAISPAVDGCIDPLVKFTPNMSALDVCVTAFRPFGFLKFSPSDEANRNVVTGAHKIRSKVVAKTTTSTENVFTVIGDKITTTPKSVTTTVTELVDPTRPGLSTLPLTALVPDIGNGCYEFASKLCGRLGLHIYVNALGDTIIVSEPDYESRPLYRLVRKDGRCDYIEATSSRSSVQQPSVIIATGRAGNAANFTKTKLKVAKVNELVGIGADGKPLPGVVDALGRHKPSVTIPSRPQLIEYGKQAFRHDLNRPLYLHDEESKDLRQLTYFVQREMAHRQKGALEVKVVIEGHTQSGVPWAVNTLVDVDDDVLDLHEPLWISERVLSKDRNGGTTTTLTLIRRWTLDLSGG